MRGKPPLLCLFLLCVIFNLTAQTQNNPLTRPAHHNGTVTAIIFDDNERILSSGEDGFLLVWDISRNAVIERFQISFSPIRGMVKRPGKTELAFLEVNNAGLSRISVWDYEKKENLFTQAFSPGGDQVFYSAGGSFIIVTGRNRTEWFDSETGESLGSPFIQGTASFAATGLSERSMVTYINTGFLRYFDLETREETRAVNVPLNIRSPLLLGNNRFLAGFDSNGLVVLDAINGNIIIRESGIRNGILFTHNPEGLEFMCLVPEAVQNNPALISHYIIESPGRLRSISRRNIPHNLPAINTGAVIADNAAALGTQDGRIIIFGNGSNVNIMDSGSRTPIIAAAASSDQLAFLTENIMGFIPLDFTQLYSRPDLRISERGNHNSISAGDKSFIFWHSENTSSYPLYINFSNNQDNLIEQLNIRFPFRAVSIYNNLLLFLNSAGNISIINNESGDIIHSSIVPGAQDAVFIDERNILIGRSAANQNSAFLIYNIITGETVPLALQADLGIKVIRGSTGFFGAGISRRGTGFRTIFFAIDAANPGRSREILEFDSDAGNLAMAEARGVFIATTEAASGLFLKRSSGLPIILLNAGNYFISVDTDGNIVWHNTETGNIHAIFRFDENNWVLESFRRAGSSDITIRETISGRVTHH